MLYAFVTESGLLGRLSQDDSAAAAEQVQNLNKLFGIVQRVGPLLRDDRVPEFMGHLDLLGVAGDDPQAAVADTDEEAVQLLTAHNAKGLEFGVVYVVNLVEGTALAGTTADNSVTVASLCRRPNGTDTDNANADWQICTVLSPGAANP